MEPQEISILLLGDSEVGKSTFLSRIAVGPNQSGAPLPGLRDLDQPFIFDLNGRVQPYRLEFYDTSSPTAYSLLKPNLIILCFSITSRPSLESLKSRWKTIVETHFNYDESLPVLVLGLKRDLRREGVDGMVFPQEALRVAAEMRCDRYCECSSVTGELCREVWEDVVNTAIATTTARGGKSDGTSCILM